MGLSLSLVIMSKCHQRPPCLLYDVHEQWEWDSIDQFPRYGFGRLKKDTRLVLGRGSARYCFGSKDTHAACYPRGVSGAICVWLSVQCLFGGGGGGGGGSVVGMACGLSERRRGRHTRGSIPPARTANTEAMTSFFFFFFVSLFCLRNRYQLYTIPAWGGPQC